MQIIRLLAKMPTLAAFAFRHNMGQPYVYPDNDLGYAGNFLSMMYRMTELKYEPDPRLERALDVLFILHADHEQNASDERGARGRHRPRWIPIQRGRGREWQRSTGRCTAAPTRQCCKHAHARSGRVENIPDFLKGVEAGQRAPDGLRAQGLQELRSARAQHPANTVDDVFAVAAVRARCWRWPRELEKRAHRATNTSPHASSTRTSISTPA